MQQEYAPILGLWIAIFWIIYFGARLKNEDENHSENYLEKIKVKKFRYLLWLNDPNREVLKLSYISQLFAIGSLLFGGGLFLLLLTLNKENNKDSSFLYKCLIYYPFIELGLVTIYTIYVYIKEARDRRRANKGGKYIIYRKSKRRKKRK